MIYLYELRYGAHLLLPATVYYLPVARTLRAGYYAFRCNVTTFAFIPCRIFIDWLLGLVVAFVRLCCLLRCWPHPTAPLHGPCDLL